MSKKLIVALLVTSLLLPIAIGILCPDIVGAASQEYWGSAKSDKFHYPSCQWAKKIHQENLIIFESRKEALDAGYVPCKVCKP